MLCYFCSTDVDSTRRVFRADTCPSCGKDLHACVQCQFYDPHVHNQCREPKAEFQANRERANFCDYFQPSQAGNRRKPKDSTAAARRALEDLFKSQSDGS